MSTTLTTAPSTAAERIRRQVREKRVTRAPPQAMSTMRNKSAQTPNPNVRSKQIINKREISNQSLLRRLNNGKKVQLARGKIQRNSSFTRDAKIRQLLNTYLTFAYDMGPGMEVKHFAKYVILIMFSMDQIVNSTRNNEIYGNLYERVDSMTGTVSLKIQEQFATLISGYLRNVGKIKANTSSLLYKSLQQTILKRKNNSLNTV